MRHEKRSAFNLDEIDLVRDFSTSLSTALPWDSITDFALHKSFCGQSLYPRQLTLLKLIFLETENMTAYDLEVIEEWRNGFLQHKEVAGVQPDIWERVDWLKQRGYKHFPHIQSILGRRGSKGVIGGILGAYMLSYFLWLDNWQQHFGVKAHSDGYLSVIATTLDQAKRFQFNDIKLVVEACGYLQPYIYTDKEYYLSIQTPSDKRYLNELVARKIPIEREIASLKAMAFSANSSSSRGGAGFANFLDEFAWQITGTGSVKTSEQIYAAVQPSLRQFKKDSLTYIPSTPYCLAPETKVLTHDLTWVPVGSLVVGDEIVGFDEHRDDSHRDRHRSWRKSVVTETNRIVTKSYKVTFENGKEVICSGEHLWLARASQLNWEWVETHKLSGTRQGTPYKVKTFGSGETWSSEDTRDGGYLAGIYDGEGSLGLHVDSNGLKTFSLDVSQNVGVVQEEIDRLLKERDFDVQRKFVDSIGNRVESSKHINWHLRGGVPEIARLLGSIRPTRLLSKYFESDGLYGMSIFGRYNQQGLEVVSVEEVGEKEVVALGTSTHTLVAEGLLSHNSQVGQFFTLYNQGIVLMPEYVNGHVELKEQTEKSLGIDAEEVLLKATANPTMLVIQLPSWEMYKDYDRSHLLPVRKNSTELGRKLKSAVVEYNEEMQILEKVNPEAFRVEYRAQFATVQDAYLKPEKVEAMFVPPDWRPPLSRQDAGILARQYRIHCDPGLSGANFSMCIGHLEEAPPDEDGKVWPHVIIDQLHVWRPMDYEDNVVDYVEIQQELIDTLNHFPSTTALSMDQWQSAFFLRDLQNRFSPQIRIAQETFDEKSNQARFEKFKSALNLGWIHSYKDNFYIDNSSCLLELELKFLQMVNGRVKKQDVGPVTTKDLADSVMVVVTDLLHDALDMWSSQHLNATAFGSTDTPGLRSGREEDRLRSFQSGSRQEKFNQMLNQQRADLSRFRSTGASPTRGRF